ncbi:MAG: catechol 2,3-dioxygenase-like lactoylglutathione lyase family enzyme [Candidatus Aldehydirespiratoraceae bacterium]|jgi:catechol 2,3-dioxygenase-like lactoylglutathione lyase family enzyme
MIPPARATPLVEVVGHDHVVLNVADPERSLVWYRDKLGLVSEREAEWRAGEVPFLSLRVNEHTVIDLFVAERTGLNLDHFSMRVADDVDLEVVAASGEFDVISGPSRIWGAQGYGLGLYVRDPDGNTVELKHYGPDRETS